MSVVLGNTARSVIRLIASLFYIAYNERTYCVHNITQENNLAIRVLFYVAVMIIAADRNLISSNWLVSRFSLSAKNDEQKRLTKLSL